ncbi:hypothetical protein [Legionella sp. W05-934-2]|jgi:hypothetical protein|uniref:hypothetical protein n=1 Tax=Legionella sp. W05-934-2 TaxID=1198649 RepID=UPI003462578D
MKHYIAMIVALSALFSNTYASQEISLPWNKISQTNQAEHIVSLNGLQPYTAYNVSCSFFNSLETSVDFLISPRLLPESQYRNVQLNQKPLANNHGQLQAGNNLISFDIEVQKEDSQHYNQLTLKSDSNTPPILTECIATPLTNNVRHNQHSEVSSGGYFFAYNDTNHPVTITVGNFFPTKYAIKPHGRKMVWVSTDNQDIHVIG